MRRLVLVRHSKASHDAVTDLERPLTSKGAALAGLLAKELRKRRPDLPIILASGYSEELALSGYEGFEFLPKPYSIEQISRLLEKITFKG